jgi:hypothetical protein
MMDEELAYETVGKIISDLTDRRGLRQEWENIDEETQDEIHGTWTKIVLDAYAGSDQ